MGKYSSDSENEKRGSKNSRKVETRIGDQEAAVHQPIDPQNQNPTLVLKKSPVEIIEGLDLALKPDIDPVGHDQGHI
ncbi:hypothetical protein NQ317_006297 [Molorchus minor]|uniref:Uncharacterized protein n=1 Tax=Molorchus minor TaxID=1323400 RepID=A0ABQ9JCU6_9CUCU|nr:hypothetical protein NQ317_006297 [Molorchus minor]